MTTATDERLVYPTEAETVALIEASGPGYVLHLTWGAIRPRLIDEPGNEWAFAMVERMRSTDTLPSADAVAIREAGTPNCDDLYRVLPGNTGVYVLDKLFTVAVAIGSIGSPVYDDSWCYDGWPSALAAVAAWDVEGGQTEPEGWHRHPRTGRRRPDGDASQEYISK
jgi:hypothetical protein